MKHLVVSILLLVGITTLGEALLGRADTRNGDRAHPAAARASAGEGRDRSTSEAAAGSHD